MNSQFSVDDLLSRIGISLSKYDKAIPKEVITCWQGYLGALLEWGVLSVEDHDKLTSYLPLYVDSPIIDIMLGR